MEKVILKADIRKETGKKVAKDLRNQGLVPANVYKGGTDGALSLKIPVKSMEEALQTMAKKIMANSPQSIAAYKRLYNSNENMTLDKSLELEFGSEFEITDSLERLGQFAK